MCCRRVSNRQRPLIGHILLQIAPHVFAAIKETQVMHRDKKVGLALAILLCSIVGAFFFRDDAPRNNGPELRDGQRLDQEIARNPRVPYSDAESRSRGTDPRRPTDRTRDGFQQSDLPEWLRNNPDGGNSTVQRNRVNGSRDPSFNSDRLGNSPDFNTLTPPPQDAPAIPIPLHNGDWEAVASNDGSGLRRSGTEVAPATSGLTRSHVVVDGETLSSIAGKYLGSQARYQEIFQANRDQLKSANDLKIGMKLTIPDRAETRSTSGQRGNTKTDPTVRTTPPVNNSPNRVTERSQEPAGPADARKPKFKPAKTGPAIRRTTDASDEESLGNKLSQVAPSDLLEVDEGVLAELERDLEPQVAEKPVEVTKPK
ncbi:MAG: LysM peptidoglycan-binding domain-containing protein [Planctomycetaceae bacterium]|nr:LysM peptidoglycan-binding domain-containing protein [Planctomycetaceae bacterium]